MDHARASGDDDRLLSEQRAYYRAVAAEYGDHALPDGAASAKEIAAGLTSFEPRGDVLELACGPGTWTPHLLEHAHSVTCVDASTEMLAIARSRLEGERVRFVCADIFGWEPDRPYDVVFFGLWLSHVPPDRFGEFWSMVFRCLKPGGRVFFVDDGYRTEDELIAGERGFVVRRRLNDGSAHRIVKVPLTPAELERQLERLGWRIVVTRTSTGPFFWGEATRAGSSLVTKQASFSASSVQRLLAECDREASQVYPGAQGQEQGSAVATSDFDPPHGRCLVAELDGEAAGCGGLRALSDGAAEIKRLYVSSGVRRKGIGSRLLDDLERLAAGAGYRTVRLDTGPRQPAALGLFRSRGYVEIPDYNGNELAAYWFEKRL